MSIEFIKFIANLMYDNPDIYFNSISKEGKLDILLKIVALDPKDFNVVNNYAKLLNAIGHCIFNYKPNSADDVET